MSKEDKFFVCANCGDHCQSESDWTEEDAVAELEENFPGAPVESCSEVCDKCWEMIRPRSPADFVALGAETPEGDLP